MRLTRFGPPSSLVSQLILAAFGGLAMSLAFPPVALWPIAFAAVVPLLWLLRTVRPARGALVGFVYGAAGYGITLSWIDRFGTGAWVALTALCALSTAVVGLLAPLVVRPGRTVLSALGFAALWTVLDFARGAWPFGGFTWGALGISQADNRLTLRLASITGVWGVTFVVVVVNGLLLSALADGGATSRRTGRLTLALGFALAPGLVPFPAARGRPIDIAAVQVDVRRSAAPGDIALMDAAAQRTLRADPPDLVVWGEGAVDPAALGDPAIVATIRSAIGAVGAPTVIGAVVDDADGAQHTSALVFDGGGRQVQRYDKVHLVPFGEYVPFRDALSWVRALAQVPIDRVPGERIRSLSVVGLPPFGTPICFENSFPAVPRAMVRDGAGFLIVPVNNASYGFSAAGAQHLQMSRMRAVEDGRWVVDAAVSGPSAFIDPSGRVQSEAGLFAPAILRTTIRSSNVRTWYVRLGDWFPWFALALAGGVALTPRRRSGLRARRHAGPLTSDPRTLVILPTYQEAETVTTVLGRLRQLPSAPDVLVVDDDSPDGTANLVRKVAAGDQGVHLTVRPKRTGLAGAYLEGFRHAVAEGYDLVVEMDADLSHDPGELPRLLLVATEHDLTVGSRYIPGGSVTNWSRPRVALSRGGNRYVRLMLGLPFRDATSGFRVYRRELLERLLEQPFHSDGYGFQVELVLRAWRMGFDVAETPITFSERVYGESKISRRIVLEALWLVTRWGLSSRMGRALPGDEPR
ncbi:MAG: apolipoprotein N-acyltransferase [Actinomycetota bacterium]